MGCLHSSDGIASLLKKKKRTSDNSNSGPNNEEENAVQSTAANAPTIFTFDQLAAATENFKADNLVGEGGFGRVYKGKLEDFDQIVAVKRQDRKGDQGLDEFSNELSTLSLLDHPNLVKLIGYCSEEHEKLLVYEFMPLGSLDKHLYGAHPNKKQLDWKSRLKIAADAARGLAYLHDRAKPPIVHRDFKTSNILLDEDLNVKLSDFGLAKEGPVGDQTHVLAPVTGTYGYCAPDYRNTGRLTFKSDVYSFGVVLLELITGRKALDGTRPIGEVDLVSWALRLFKKKKKFRDMVDPALEGRYPSDGLYYALSICVDCLHEKADSRPVAANVVRALDILVSQNNDPQKDSHGAGPSGVKKGDEGEG